MKKITFLFCFSFFLTQLANAQTSELLGMTPKGGNYNGGVIFKMAIGGANFDTLYSFNSPTGDAPSADLFKAANGLLYGTTFYGGSNLFGAIFSYDASKNLYTDVHDFDTTTGIQSEGNFIQTSAGNLYGMTGGGGAHNFGVLYRLNPISNTYLDIHDFDSTKGSYPYGDLLLSGNGLLYGMTQFGGANDFGVIFSYDTSNNIITDLHDFDGTNGQWPYGSLVQVGNKLFGVTANGGANGEGVIFSYDISTSVFTKLYDFDVNSGGGPSGNLVMDAGVFYGTASGGGLNGDGVIFRFDTTSNTYSDLFDFDGGNGQTPPASMLLASDNDLYGMTSFGGADSSDGTVFSFNSDCNDIHNFNGIEGQNPSGNLIEINTAGIKQLAPNNNQLLIYPNPVNGIITISSEKSINEVRITNLLGQLIYTFGEPQGNTSSQIDLSNLPTGMYFVSVTSNNKTITNKISIISKYY